MLFLKEVLNRACAEHVLGLLTFLLPGTPFIRRKVNEAATAEACLLSQYNRMQVQSARKQA